MSQYFPPEMGAPAARVDALSRLWAEAGHDVTVLTAFPHHPTGVKRPEHRGRLFLEERRGAVRVLRSYVFATPNRGWRRVWGYLSFMASSIATGVFAAPRPGVLVATSPHFFTAVSGYLVSLLRDCPFVFEVRDLWPRAIVEVGAMRDNPLLRLLERLELFLYSEAALVVVVTQGTRNLLVQRGVPAGKILVIPNGVEPGEWEGMEREVCRRKWGMDGKFVVSYVGTLGMSHGLEHVLAAMAELRVRPEARGLECWFVGEGAQAEVLRREAEEKKLENVRFLGEKTRREAMEIMAASDAALIPLRDLPLFEITIPSKLFEAMAAARPVLLAVKGEARAILEEAGCGLAVEPESAAAMSEAMLRLKQSPGEAEALGARGRKCAVSLYNRTVQARRYLEAMEPLGA